MNLSEKDLAYLKKTLTAQDLIDLVAMKHKMNERSKRSGSPVNESETVNEFKEEKAYTYIDGFKKFCEEYLDDNEKRQVQSIFSKLAKDVVNQRFLQAVYSSVAEMIDKIDQEMIDNAN